MPCRRLPRPRPRRTRAWFRRRSTAPRNPVEVQQGDAGQEMFFVREGAMDVVILVERAGSEVAAKLEKVVATLKSGSFFGEISLILQERRTASMKAASPIPERVSASICCPSSREEE